MARQVTENRIIPTKRVVITDPGDMPADYSSTPGGTLYSTTPGGSRIVYERAFLLKLSQSPISKTSPTKFDIPEGLLRGSPPSPNSGGKSYKQHPVTAKKQRPARSPLASVSSSHEDDDAQFQMDM